MSPQRSNRSQLLEGTLRCLERLPPERVTARAIAAESGANIASIAYHFGSKDELVTEAVIAGLDRWLEEIAGALGEIEGLDPAARFRRPQRLHSVPPGGSRPPPVSRRVNRSTSTCTPGMRTVALSPRPTWLPRSRRRSPLIPSE